MIQRSLQTAIAEAAVQDEQRTPGFFWRFARSRTALLSLAFIVVVTLAAIFGPLLYGVDPTRTDFASINAPPSPAHPLGADKLGHDMLARLFAALQVSLLVAAVAETINI